MPRLILASRRPCNTLKAEYVLPNGQSAEQIVTIGFDPDDLRPREVFLPAIHGGAELDLMLADFAVAVSVALQSGVTAQSMAKSIARVPETLDGEAVRPASVFGAVLDVLAKFEKREL